MEQIRYANSINNNKIMLPIGNVPGMGNYTNNQQMHQQINTQWQPVMNNPAISYPMLPSTTSQQTSSNYLIAPMQQQILAPMHQQMLTPVNNFSNVEHIQHLQRMTSTSEDEEDIQNNSKNEWQVIRSTKRKKITRSQQNTSKPNIETKNRYSLLTNEINENTIDGNPRPAKIQTPPPIFVHGVINYAEMIKRIRDVAEEEQYCTKSLTNNVIKIICTTPETYRKLVRYFTDNNIYYHTYQLKEERAYRVVIKYLHHSTNTEDIKQELYKLGHKVRNIINAQHRTTKEPLNIFFVDIEPADNNKEIYSIKALQNKIIQIEPPRVIKNSIIQCTRCQQYGHTKSYCNKPYVCVKCGGSHNTTDCKKSKETPAKCALCGGSHPANYKGCVHYHNLIKGNNKIKNNTQRTIIPPVNTNTYRNNIQHNSITQQQMSYADASKMNTNQVEDTANTLTKFLEEFKGIFNQLLQQNSMVLNMLTMLMNKLN